MSTIHAPNFQHWHWVIPNPSGKQFHYIAVRAGDQFAYAEHLSSRKFDRLLARLKAGESLPSVFRKHAVVSTEAIEHVSQGEQLGGVVVTCRAGTKPRRIKLLQAKGPEREELFASVASKLAPETSATEEPVSPREAMQTPALVGFLIMLMGGVFWSVAYSTAGEPGGGSGGSRRYRGIDNMINELGTTGILGVIAVGVIACGLWGAIRLARRATKQVVHLSGEVRGERSDATVLAV